MKKRLISGITAALLVVSITLGNSKSIRDIDTAANRYGYAGIDREEGTKFFNTIKKYVSNSNINGLSGLMHYPLTYVKNGREVVLHTKAEFIRSYNDVFNQRIQNIVLVQNEDDLIIDWRGMSFGYGEICCGGINGGGVKVFSINAELDTNIDQHKPLGRKLSDKKRFKNHLIKTIEANPGLEALKKDIEQKGAKNIFFNTENRELKFSIPAGNWWYSNKKEYQVIVRYNQGGKRIGLVIY